MAICIPFMDDLPALRVYEWTQDAKLAIMFSCCMALAVNMSQFKIIGNLSAIT
jgi:hypothetical protein